MPDGLGTMAATAALRTLGERAVLHTVGTMVVLCTTGTSWEAGVAPSCGGYGERWRCCGLSR